MNTLNRQIAGKPGKDSAGCTGRLKVMNFYHKSFENFQHS